MGEEGEARLHIPAQQPVRVCLMVDLVADAAQGRMRARLECCFRRGDIRERILPTTARTNGWWSATSSIASVSSTPSIVWTRTVPSMLETSSSGWRSRGVKVRYSEPSAGWATEIGLDVPEML